MDFLINGKKGQIDPLDRSFLYGDSIFRTFIVEDKKPLFWKYQYKKLVEDSKAIKIKVPSEKTILDGIKKLFTKKKSIARVVLSRGNSELGYRIDKKMKPNLIIIKADLPKFKKEVDLFLCSVRLMHSSLGGIKHSNRLENIMARAEWDNECDDGILLDKKGHVVECVSSNIFIRYGKKVYTPKLDDIGVRGAMRSVVMDVISKLDYDLKEKNFDLKKLLNADEVFITNSVSGIRQVKCVRGRTSSWWSKKCYKLSNELIEAIARL